MLETLADHDDELMEQLLEEIEPPRDKVFDDLARELREGLVCPVLIGSATRTNGVLRLLKALRHEAPGVAETAKRLGVTPSGDDAVAHVMKTLHTAHGGKLSVARVLPGTISEGRAADRRLAARPSRALRPVQADRPDEREARAGPGRRDRGARQARPCQDRRPAHDGQAGAGDADRREGLRAGARRRGRSSKERKDDVKLGQALNKLVEEDPSLGDRAQSRDARGDR